MLCSKFYACRMWKINLGNNSLTLSTFRSNSILVLASGTSNMDKCHIGKTRSWVKKNPLPKQNQSLHKKDNREVEKRCIFFMENSNWMEAKRVNRLNERIKQTPTASKWMNTLEFIFINSYAIYRVSGTHTITFLCTISMVRPSAYMYAWGSRFHTHPHIRISIMTNENTHMWCNDK